MRRGTRRNRAFDIMTDRFGSMIDPSHFGGKSSFSIKRKKTDRNQEFPDQSGQMALSGGTKKISADKRRVSIPA